MCIRDRYLAETIHNSGIPLEEFQLRVGAFGAEPWTENMRKELEQKLNIKAYDIYGLTEICGPGVGGECECQNLSLIHISWKYTTFTPRAFYVYVESTRMASLAGMTGILVSSFLILLILALSFRCV